jgi:hypothetical protein
MVKFAVGVPVVWNARPGLSFRAEIVESLEGDLYLIRTNNDLETRALGRDLSPLFVAF